jgi:hypothetical protein
MSFASYPNSDYAFLASVLSGYSLTSASPVAVPDSSGATTHSGSSTGSDDDSDVRTGLALDLDRESSGSVPVPCAGDTLLGTAWNFACHAAPLAFGIGWRALGGTPVRAAVGAWALQSLLCPPVTRSLVTRASVWSGRLCLSAALSVVLAAPMWFTWNIWFVGPVSLFVPVVRGAYLDTRHAFLAVTLGAMTFSLIRSEAYSRFAASLSRTFGSHKQ